MEYEKITAWVTKYALTFGIEEVFGEICGDGSMLKYMQKGPFPVFAHGEGKGWHRTPEAAIARAEEMRKAKIASLKKSIAKIEKMEFKVKSAE